METLTIEQLRENNLIIYECYRGSYPQGTYIEGISDKDVFGIFMLPHDYLYGLRDNYIPQVANATNDIVFYEMGRYMELIIKQNPTIIESLFVDDKFVIYKHPIMELIKPLGELYITKQLVNNTVKFATSQIKKCTSDEKLFSHPTVTLKSPLEFCYTYYNQGSTKLVNWLNNKSLHQKFCGLVKIPNMHNEYGVYYDWKAHFNEYPPEDNDINSQNNKRRKDVLCFISMSLSTTHSQTAKAFNELKLLGYSGIVDEDGSSKSIRFIQDNHSEKHGVMLNSVGKGHMPICYMSYNADGYSKHARDYARYQKWLKERNPIRYENNKDYRYDAKNVMHCFRLLNMAIEMAQGLGVRVNREHIDREFLLEVRNHKYSYEELMEMLKEKEKEMQTAIEASTLPENIDKNKINKLLIDIRKDFYKK